MAQINKNIDMSVTMWGHVQASPINIQKRPPPVKLGREVSMKLNTWDITKFPSNVVHQYDVLIGSGSEPAGLVKKILASKSLRAGLPNGHRWLFAGALIAWSSEKVDELRITVDLDAEQGRAPGKKPNTFYVKIQHSTTVRFDTLSAYLSGKTDFDATCLSSINFLDHLLREYPSQRMTLIKRNFYWPGQQFFDLGGGLQACKGLYQSIRIVHGQSNQHKLSVNADVANCAFWKPGPLWQAVAAVLGCRSEADIARFAVGPRAEIALKPLRRIHVETKHRGQVDDYCIEKLTQLTPNKHKLTGGDQSGLTVAEYFRNQYKVVLKHPDWPLVKMTRGQNTVLPLELLTIKPFEKYNRKLDERQTANMIKMAVTVPGQRWNDIRNGLEQVKWDKDPYLNGYGLKISTDPVMTKGRLLPNPKVLFANGPVDPRTSGRWRVDGKKFMLPNKITLSSWGVGVIPDPRTRYDKTIIEKFIKEFVKTYLGHGGKVEVQAPFINLTPPNADIGETVKDTYTKTGQTFNKTPQLLIFILPSKDAMTYGKIKKSADCRYGVPSQCMQYQNVMKCQGQYISNVLLKVHCKLGGTVARAAGPMTTKTDTIFKVPTMIVGADVTHPPPTGQGTVPADEQPGSIAAVVTSMDKSCVRYIANVNTNGWRQEIIQTDNWTKLWKPMLLKWMSQVGGGRLPQQIIYARDGVSEGQFAAVINQEVKDMRDVIKKMDPASNVKFIVIIATKRHHVRFVGERDSGDKNGNPLPGTVIETGVTHPFENDFFLCSHVALKGTARPCHYHVLVNEPGLSNEELMTMLYEHCYQFSRATTPVSLFPACYLADIAAEKGRYHDKNFGTNSSGASKPGGGGSNRSPSGSQAGAKSGTKGSSDTPSQVADLLPLHGNVLPEVMWWV